MVLGYVDVRVRVEDRVTGWVRSRAVTAIGEYEVLLNDRLVEEFGVEIVKPASGLWRFTGEVRLRASVEPMYWVE